MLSVIAAFFIVRLCARESKSWFRPGERAMGPHVVPDLSILAKGEEIRAGSVN